MCVQHVQFPRQAGLFATLLPCIVLILGLTSPARAQISPGPSQPLITQTIDETNLAVLSGNVRAEATNPANDRGRVADTFPLPHLLLQLRRPAAQEQALDALIDRLHDPHSPQFHHWLRPSELASQFGPAPSDIQAVSDWLRQHGFTVNTVYPNGMVIDFSGTAGQVRSAFHTEIHNLLVNGAAHFANVSDPRIPVALAPAVAGIVSLHDFRPKHAFSNSPNCYAYQVPGASCYQVAPADLATIYNFNPLFQAGITGQGQTIYLVEDSDLYTVNDWTKFRSLFGLSVYSGASLTTIHPPPTSGPNNCSDPGVNGSDGEAALDAEWASAAAPSAAIVMATCADSGGTGGWAIAIENLLNSAQPPDIISMSYLDCEPDLGASAQAALASAYQTGVAAGTSIFVSAGDQGAAQCDYDATVSKHGISVNGFASTPYNVAVGGTDYGDTYLGQNSTYWNATNSPVWGSAKSYIPEIPWNSTCASQLVASYEGFSTTYGSTGFCDNLGKTLTEPWAGGGGPSGCATGSPSIALVVSGTCAGYAKPSWQKYGTIGIPNDGVRDLPDVSLLAAQGPWGHTFVFCWSDQSHGGAPCTDNNGVPDEYGFGTSASSPIMAGVQALIDQNAHATEGNPNYQLYNLATQAYGRSGSSICNSTRGYAVSGLCLFHDVTFGDIDVPCQPDSGTLYDCYRPSGTNGVLSTSNSSYAPAFGATTGWDFATGLGSVNVANLVKYFIQPYYGLTLTDAHDVNGDGYSDIAWRDSGGNTALWLMNSGPTVQLVSLGSVSTDWSIVGQRDLDGDGNADLLWRDGSGNIAVWLMSNAGTVQSNHLVGNVPTNWTIYGTADLNGDRMGDLLWRDTAGDIAIWFMNGWVPASVASLGNVLPAWSIVGEDAKGDVFWRDTAGDVAIWRVNGTQVTMAVGLGNVPTNWVMAGFGDFGGNGNVDILWRDTTSGATAIWFLNASLAIQSTRGLGIVPLSWSIAETGDYNGDGFSDIVWVDTSGNLAIWFMNNGAVASNVALGSVGANWTVQATNGE